MPPVQMVLGHQNPFILGSLGTFGHVCVQLYMYTSFTVTFVPYMTHQLASMVCIQPIFHRYSVHMAYRLVTP